ncbi:MAG: hypothetical protein RLZZ127_422 [Planctomycetota bacterium]|jgi:DNA-binding NtrC family response regulator
MSADRPVVLVIDDEPSLRSAVGKALADCDVIEAADLAAGLAAAKDRYPDLVLLDQQLPDGEGIAAVPRFKAIDPDLPVVLLTGHGSGDLASDAFKGGISDYLEKPFKLDRLRVTVKTQLDKLALGRQVARLAGKREGRSQLVARDPASKKVLAMIARVAGVPATTVLIQGESGVGKELVARAIHERSARAEHPFVAINCAALSEHLLEAELFGYEKGAFTGADSKGKAGLFEAADGGTVFLDEVGEMPLPLQTKLLRALQERRYRRVGGLTDVAVDVRVVAATNRDLRSEVAAGRFRQDLYFRLKVVGLQVPALRERRDDILPLAEHLLKKLGPELGRPGIGLAADARAALLAYAWPGNVRELSNAIERAVITADGAEIRAADLVLEDESLVGIAVGTQPAASPVAAPAVPVAAAPAAPAAPALPPGTIVLPPGERNLARIESQVVKAALAEAGGQKSRAAEMLGINRTTLYSKLKDIGAE